MNFKYNLGEFLYVHDQKFQSGPFKVSKRYDGCPDEGCGAGGEYYEFEETGPRLYGVDYCARTAEEIREELDQWAEKRKTSFELGAKIRPRNESERHLKLREAAQKSLIEREELTVWMPLSKEELRKLYDLAQRQEQTVNYMIKQWILEKLNEDCTTL